MPTKLERRSGPGVGAPVRHHGASAANAAGRRVSGRLDIEYHAEIVVRIEIGLILALAYPGAKEIFDVPIREKCLDACRPRMFPHQIEQPTSIFVVDELFPFDLNRREFLDVTLG